MSHFNSKVENSLNGVGTHYAVLPSANREKTKSKTKPLSWKPESSSVNSKLNALTPKQGKVVAQAVRGESSNPVGDAVGLLINLVQVAGTGIQGALNKPDKKPSAPSSGSNGTGKAVGSPSQNQAPSNTNEQTAKNNIVPIGRKHQSTQTSNEQRRQLSEESHPGSCEVTINDWPSTDESGRRVHTISSDVKADPSTKTKLSVTAAFTDPPLHAEGNSVEAMSGAGRFGSYNSTITTNPDTEQKRISVAATTPLDPGVAFVDFNLTPPFVNASVHVVARGECHRPDGSVETDYKEDVVFIPAEE